MLTSRVLSRLARSKLNQSSRITSTSIAIIRPISHHARSLSTIPTSTTTSTSLASGPTEGAIQLAQKDPEVAEALKEIMSQPRETMEYDVVIVGAGPAGLSAAIRLKQLASQGGTDISVCVVEKGAEVGAHVLSGNVFEPRALNELIPEWKEKGAPLLTPVTADKFQFLTATRAIPLPPPPPMHNRGNYIISLGALCKWLAKQAEELGVEIYPGFSAAEILYDEQGAVTGIATADVGIGKDGKPKDSFARGMELRAKQTLFAEGVRGSLSELIQKKYNLRQGVEPQTYGIGLKEVWEIPASQHQQGLVIHTLGYPVGLHTWEGTFMYHMAGNKVHLGMVVGLDYKNPYLNPYNEFQRWKHHPAVAKYLKGGTCLSYGARAINEGGYQAIPKLTFPGGALLGCSAGFLNVPKIKGSHTAMKSGMVAAEAIYKQVVEGGGLNPGQEIKEYETSLKSSWVYKELYAVRNIHPGFSRGPAFFFLNSALETYITKGKVPWTLHGSGKHDWEMTEPASKHKPIDYPKPDGILSFDLLNNLQRSGTNHNHDQPAHLRVKPELSSIPIDVSYKTYAAPETRFCPARVYEVLTDDNGGNARLQINAQNCVHCKTCDIKTPKNYIKWTVPEGGGGPAYENM